MSSTDAQQDEYYDIKTLTFRPLSGIRTITPSYLTKADEKSTTLTEPQKLLVILDLNGTLFYRRKEPSGRAVITSRPYLPQFLRFLFKHFRVMVWSSARRESVREMLAPLNAYPKMDRVWGREDFGFEPTDFHRKVLTLKDLERVWEHIAQEKQRADASDLSEKYSVDYDQTNTVLIDDSIHKSQLQPYNTIVIPDFDTLRTPEERAEDQELLKVWQYLYLVMFQSNVSHFMKEFPFDTNSRMLKRPVAEMEVILNIRNLSIKAKLTRLYAERNIMFESFKHYAEIKGFIENGLTEEQAKRKLAAEAAERQRIEAQDAALKEILDSAAAEKKKMEEEMARAAEAKAREIAAAKEAAERASKAVEEARLKAQKEADRLLQEKKALEERTHTSPSTTKSTSSNLGTTSAKQSEKPLDASAPSTGAAQSFTQGSTSKVAPGSTAQASSTNDDINNAASSTPGSEKADPLEPIKARLLPYQQSLKSSTMYIRSALPDSLRQLQESVKRKDYKDTVAQLSEHLNNFTGYNAINDLKRKVITHGDSLDEARIKLLQAKQTYEDAIGTRSDTQKAINDLLQRKHLWSPNDVIRFTDLYRSEHANEQAEQKAKAEYKQSESDVEDKSRKLTRVIMERYHEEQVWSDKIRAASTYGTWGLVTVNVMAFLIVQAFVEPRRRRKQVERYEELVQDLTDRGMLPGSAVGQGLPTTLSDPKSTTGFATTETASVPAAGSPQDRHDSTEGSTAAVVSVGGALFGGEDILSKMIQSAERTEERLDRMEALLVKSMGGAAVEGHSSIGEDEASPEAVALNDEEDVVAKEGTVAILWDEEDTHLGENWREETWKGHVPGAVSIRQEKPHLEGRLTRILRDGNEEIPAKRTDFLLTGLGGALLGGLVTAVIMLNR
ncbi:sensitivity to high expression protein she9 [Podila epigama]|nr:sensitivity to high expression protein she9 [Podila epigama]